MAPAAAVLALSASLVSAVFAAFVWRRFLRRRRPHQIAWAVGLTLYAVAALVEARVALSGWTLALYRFYFPTAADLVGILGFGALLIEGNRWVARVSAVLLGTGIVTAALGPFLVPLTLNMPVTIEDEARPLDEWGTDLGGKAIPLPHPSRVAFLLLNVLGGTALIGGALTAWWRARSPGLLLIGVGALLPFLGGSLSTLGVPEARIVAQFAGVVVMFTGYALGEAAAPRTAPPLEAPAPRT